MQSGRAGDSGALRPEPWERLDGVQGWHSLVLPQTALEQLKGVPAQFGERFWTTSAASLGSPLVDGKRGLLLLFAGPRGTGKTLAARSLAGALHLPVLQADLEAMFARGRGEATQLVARLFATAQRLGAVMVLDNADAVLRAASSGGTPGIAGMAAIDVRDLLRRSEAHPGVVIFPTTISGELSPAMLARFDQVIEFPLPDRTGRAEIWRRALPEDARVHDDDLSFLARGFELSGRQIADCCAQAERQALRAGRAVLLGDIADVLERSPEVIGAGGAAALAELRRLAGAAPATEPPSPSPEPEPEAEPEPEPSAAAEAPPAPVPPAPVEGEAAKPRRRQRPQRLRAPAAARKSPPTPHLTRRGLATVGVLGALGAVVLGLSAAEPRSRTRTTTVTTTGTLSFDRTALVGSARFSYPSSWSLQRARSLNPGPGLTFTDAVTVTSTASPAGLLTVGTTRSRAADTPLPTRFVRGSMIGTPLAQEVTLGGHSFYRVVDPIVHVGARSQSVYALASGTGAVVALCQTRTVAFLALCEQVLATLRAPPARALPAKPSAAKLAYAHALNAIIVKLNAARALGARKLAAARVAIAEADAARTLALAHSEAASAVAALSPGQAAAANTALVTALRQVGIAYTDLGDAAAVVAPVTYNLDRKLVNSANAALAAALARLRALGYEVA